MEAIFESTEQALQVSFMVVSLPVRQKNTFKMVLVQALESVGTLSACQADFLAYLRGKKSSAINFDGMSAEEVRAQCAMVIAAVNDRLSGPERDAIWIKYARGIPSRPGSASVAADPGVPPSIEWKRGVFAMASYLRETLGIESRNAVMALIAAHTFPNQRQSAFSYANISKDCGVPLRTLERAAFKIRKRLRELEGAGIAKLATGFEADGLVYSDDDVAMGV